MTTTTPPMRIGIIGAGPAGLAALKTILDSPEYASGLWLPTVFESSSILGGVWHPSPSSPLYDSLTTNLPHPIMAFPSFPFPPSTPLFPPAHTVQTYLEAYADEFKLRPHILFNTPVTAVQYRYPYWHINHSHQFSLLLICNGHYNTPRLPSTPGLATWLSVSRASHSQSYRNPASFLLPLPLKDCSILVVGSGPSGLDISAELLPLAKRVFLSTSTGAPPSPPSKCTIKPRPTLFSSPSPSSSAWEVHFADNTTEQIDYCILATGYALSFPFFSTTTNTNDNAGKFSLSHTLIPSPPLHLPVLTHTLTHTSYSLFSLARHLFGVSECGFAPLPHSSSSHEHESSGTANPNQSTLPPPTSLAFPGLLVRVAPLPVVEAQARAALAVFRAGSASSTNTRDSSTNIRDTNTSTNDINDNDNTDTNTHPQIDWAAESELIKARHALLVAKFHAAQAQAPSLSNSQSPSLAPSTPNSSSNTPTPSPSQEEPDTLPLQTYLSHEWHRFEPSDQFPYRDELDDLVCSLPPPPSSPSPPSRSPLLSPSTSSTPSTKPKPTPPPPTRTRPWELPIHLRTAALRAAWRSLEARGEAEEWVRGVGEGEGEKSGEEEWVDLMWRVLKWGEEKGDGEEVVVGEGVVEI